ncbi:MAG: MATE family efflux transporter [Lachnospiraceae bacterium]|nr:MATE family efflux transporter [Lachnospiraceae bacterium]
MALLKTRDIDMTKGSPVRLMFRFATPTLIGSIFQTLYSMADSAILGRYAGSRALAAVGATAQATGFILLFAMAVTSAFSIFISQKVGAKDSEGVRRCFASAMSLTAVLGVVLGCVGIVTARPLMRLLGAPADIIDDSVLYIRIICGGCMAQFFYNAATNTLRSIGNSMTPLVILIFSSILNVILDVIAVVVLHMGVAGVASATVISQALSAVLCMVYIFRRYKDIIPKEGEWVPQRELTADILKMGLLFGLQNSFLTIGMMYIARIVNSYGSTIVAAFTIGQNVQHLTTTALYGYISPFSVYAGQNLGAKRYDRIRKGVRQMYGLAAIFCLAATLVSELFPRALVGLYLKSHETLVIEAAVSFVRIQGWFIIFLGIIEVFKATLRGMGKIPVTMASSFVELGCKILGALLFPLAMGYTGIWYAAPVGWILGIIPAAVYYYSGRWEPKEGAAPA